MVNIIRIKNASFYAYHGALSEEQNIGGIFEADVDIYTDFSEAAIKDDLKLTVNYHSVYQLIMKVANEKKYHLIESIAYKIADEIIKNYNKVQKVCVRVRKNTVPVGGVIDCVEAEVIRTNED